MAYIVILQSVVGGMDGFGFSTSYDWDGLKFRTSAAAIKHGWKIRESDDFNIGVLQNGKLVEFRWMDKPIDHNLLIIAKEIGVKAVLRKESE